MRRLGITKMKPQGDTSPMTIYTLIAQHLDGTRTTIFSGFSELWVRAHAKNVLDQNDSRPGSRAIERIEMYRGIYHPQQQELIAAYAPPKRKTPKAAPEDHASK